MKIAIGGDHASPDLKKFIVNFIYSVNKYSGFYNTPLLDRYRFREFFHDFFDINPLLF